MIKDKALRNYMYFNFFALSEAYNLEIETINDLEKLLNTFITDVREQQKFYDSNNKNSKKNQNKEVK